MNTKQIPNLVSSLRILAVPFMVALALLHDRQSVFTLLVVSQIADFLDGYLARKLNAQTVLGAKLDILGDLGNCIVVLLIIAVFFSQLLHGPGAIALALFIIAYMGRYIMARRCAGEWIHAIPMTTSKLNYYVQSALILALFLHLGDIPVIFYIAFASGFLESIDYLRRVVKVNRPQPITT